MTIRHTIDDARRLLVITLSGVVTSHEFTAFVGDLYGDRTELFDYECISDLSDYEGDVSYSDLNPLQQIYAARPERDAPSRPGIIVTLDPNFHLWASALDAQFSGRKHYIAPSLEEAFSRLDGLRTAQVDGA
jgi:hypothetical protein